MLRDIKDQARQLPTRKPTQAASNILLFRRSFNGKGPQGPDFPSPLAGASPAAHRLEAKRGLVLVQFVQTKGDTRVVARRHGVMESDVKRVIARMIGPVVSTILKEAA